MKTKKSSTMVEKDIDEGLGKQLLTGAALLASLWGVASYQAQEAYKNSPQLQQLTRLYKDAEQRNDHNKVMELRRRIKAQKERLELGYGEVMDKSGRPVAVKENNKDYAQSKQSIEESKLLTVTLPKKRLDDGIQSSKKPLLDELTRLKTLLKY